MRFLIANPFGIGDVLFSFPLIHAVRQFDPVGTIGYLCNARTHELVQKKREVDWTIVFEKDEFRRSVTTAPWKGIGYCGGILTQVRRRHFDVLIDLSLGGQISFGGWCAGIPRRIGFDYRGRGRFLTDKVPLEGFDKKPVAESYLELLRRLDIPVLSGAFSTPLLDLPDRIEYTAREYCAKQGLLFDRPFITIVPGGGASWGSQALYKQWPPALFAEVINHLLQKHQFQVLLVGDSNDVRLCQEVARHVSSPVQMALQVPSILLLGAILKQSVLVIGNDSGAMHLAAGVGSQTVTIFGPVDPYVYGPFPAAAHHRVVAQSLSCQPCYQSFHLPPCPFDIACLKKLAPGEVINAAEVLLQKR